MTPIIKQSGKLDEIMSSTLATNIGKRDMMLTILVPIWGLKI